MADDNNDYTRTNIILYHVPIRCTHAHVHNPFRKKERVPPNARKGYIIVVYCRTIILYYYYTRVITSTRHTLARAHVHVYKRIRVNAYGNDESYSLPKYVLHGRACETPPTHLIAVNRAFGYRCTYTILYCTRHNSTQYTYNVSASAVPICNLRVIFTDGANIIRRQVRTNRITAHAMGIL